MVGFSPSEMAHLRQFLNIVALQVTPIGPVRVADHHADLALSALSLAIAKSLSRAELMAQVSLSESDSAALAAEEAAVLSARRLGETQPLSVLDAQAAAAVAATDTNEVTQLVSVIQSEAVLPTPIAPAEPLVQATQHAPKPDSVVHAAAAAAIAASEISLAVPAVATAVTPVVTPVATAPVSAVAEALASAQQLHSNAQHRDGAPAAAKLADANSAAPASAFFGALPWLKTPEAAGTPGLESLPIQPSPAVSAAEVAAPASAFFGALPWRSNEAVKPATISIQPGREVDAERLKQAGISIGGDASSVELATRLALATAAVSRPAGSPLGMALSKDASSLTDLSQASSADFFKAVPWGNAAKTSDDGSGGDAGAGTPTSDKNDPAIQSASSADFFKAVPWGGKR